MNIIRTKSLKYSVKIKGENNEVIGKKQILDDVNIDIKKGEFIAVLGHNGSGKSTFAKHLNALLIPEEGSVFINGEDTNEVMELWKIRKQCGMVFQNPDNQIVGVTVEEDVGFGPENLGIPCEDIWQRVEDALDKVGMLKYREKSPNHLSGGQKQRVAIASSLAMKPECIVLDEPTAMLDPQGRRQVLKIIRQLNREAGMTIVLITHHMEEAVLADRVVVMDDGKPVLTGTPRKVFSDIDKIKELKLDLPQIMELSHYLYLRGRMSRYDVLTVDEFVEQFVKDNDVMENAETHDRKYGEKSHGNAAKSRADSEKNSADSEKVSTDSGKSSADSAKSNTDSEKVSTDSEKNSADSEKVSTDSEKSSADSEKLEENKELLRIENVSCVYESGTSMEVKAIDGVNLSIMENEFIGIIGHTGSGKSTLMQVMNGLIKPSEGRIYYRGKDISEKSFKKKELHFSVGLVFQYPESQLFEETVIKDVMFGPLNKGKSREEARKVSEDALKMMGLSEKYFEKSPFVLSGGEMRRVAIAGVIAMEPEVIILDEPTAGLDPMSRNELLNALKMLGQKEKKTVIIVSHNMEDIANYVGRLVVLNDGKIVYDDTPKKVFKHIEELEKMGLGVPQVTYALRKLKQLGYVAEDNVLTVEEAVRAIELHKERNEGNA